MSNYPSDFQSATSGYESVEPDVFFSLSPTLLALAALGLLAAAILGWLIGRRDQAVPDATGKIYDKVAEAAADAARATNLQVQSKADVLRQVIKDNLGPIIALSHGVAGPYDRLVSLLPGGDASHGTSHGPDNHASHHAGDGSANHDDAHDHANGAPTETNPVRSMIINAKKVVIGGDGSASSDNGHPPSHPPASEDTTRKVRAAVHDFYDHWSRKGERIKELEAARDLLNGPGLSN